MPEVVSAGTLVGAVLETAGYVTQEKILLDFQLFFEDAGALLYGIAAVGALFSVTLFGSYRMARYLLIGPFLFWFLTGQTSPVEPVYWTLGKKEPIRSDAAFQGELERERPEEEINVATPFLLYTNLISGIVDNVVSMILKYHEKGDYLFFGRRYALELLFDAMPQKGRLYSILLEDVFLQCGEMMGAAMALSHNDVAEVAYHYHQTQMEGEPDDSRLVEIHRRLMSKIEDQRKYFQDAFETGKAKPAKLGAAARVFIQGYSEKHRQLQQPFPIPNINIATLADQPVTCDTLWTVAKHAIMEDADKLIEDVKGVILSNGTLPENANHSSGQSPDTSDEAILCNEIAKKIGRLGDREVPTPPTPIDFDSCNIVETVAAYMLRNLILYLPYSELATTAKNKSQFYASRKRIVVTKRSREKEAPKIEWENAIFRAEVFDGDIIYKVLVNPDNDIEPEDWRAFTIVSSDGHMDAAYIYHQRYQSNYLQQSIFTWALELPYYQGCLLYLLAVAYPFMCLLVVSPGYAGRFLAYPLFWMWVKSWDIGFALVMVLEKVLWNLLPNSKVPYNAINGYNLPDIISSAFSVDPSYDIHAHYNYLYMTLLAIPPVSGYIIMKGKASVVASFTDPPHEHGDDAGQAAQGSYGMSVMDQKISGIKTTEGRTLRGVAWTEGQGGDGRMVNALGWATKVHSAAFMADFATLTSDLVSGINKANAEHNKFTFTSPEQSVALMKAHERNEMVRKSLNKLGGEFGSSFATFMRVRNAELSVKSWGDLAYGETREDNKMMSAIFAAMDAFGEHEMAHFLEGRQLLGEEVKRFLLYTELELDIYRSVVNTLASGTQAAFRSGKPQELMGTAFEAARARMGEAPAKVLARLKQSGIDFSATFGISEEQFLGGSQKLGQGAMSLWKEGKNSVNSMWLPVLPTAAVAVQQLVFDSDFENGYEGNFEPYVRRKKWRKAKYTVGFELVDFQEDWVPLFVNDYPDGRSESTQILASFNPKK